MKFGIVMLLTLLTVPTVKKNLNFENQDGGGRHLEKSKSHHISAAVLAISTKFGTVVLCDPLNNLNLENPRWRGRHLKKI